jgi:hypothetical protein
MTSRSLIRQRQTLLIAVERQKYCAMAPLARLQLARPVTLERLDLEHPRSQITKQHGAKRSRKAL